MTQPIGDVTVVPTQHSDLSGVVPSAAIPTITIAQLPTGTAIQATAIKLTAQAANIGATTLYAVTATGLFRMSVSIKRTQAATTSSTLPSVTITWTEGDNSAAGSSALIASNATNTLVATAASELIVYAKTGTNIQYALASYASSGATPMQFALEIKCEAL
jgi:hypothetical protein